MDPIISRGDFAKLLANAAQTIHTINGKYLMTRIRYDPTIANQEPHKFLRSTLAAALSQIAVSCDVYAPIS